MCQRKWLELIDHHIEKLFPSTTIHGEWNHVDEAPHPHWNNERKKTPLFIFNNHYLISILFLLNLSFSFKLSLLVFTF
jgi:hypothetical protein